MNSASNGHRDRVEKTHYTQEALRQYAANPSTDIADHLRACRQCYEAALIAKLLLHHEAHAEHSQPSPAFIQKLNAALETQPQGRMLGFPTRLAWIPAVAAAMALLVVWFFRTPAALTGELAFIHGEVLVNGANAPLLSKIKPGDEIRTGNSGVVRINFAAKADIVVMPATLIKVGSVAEGEVPDIHIEQSSGYAYHRVEPGKARYHVKSPAFETEVKGTEFTVDLEHGDGAVKLYHGKVMLHSGTSVTGMEAGNSAQPTRAGKLIFKKISADELAYAAHFQAFPFAAAARKPEDGELKQLLLGEKISWSLVDIKRKYRKISVVYTKQGMKYTGGFHTESDHVWVQTEKSKIVVPVADVTKILPYENNR